MCLKPVNVILIVFFSLFCYLPKSIGQAKIERQHVESSMRMIGHQILLRMSDSTSRVMPVKKEGGRYKISFASKFKFDPIAFVVPIDSVMFGNQITDHYLMEVEECQTEEVVYSYEHGGTANFGGVPCLDRLYSTACYNLYITIWEKEFILSSKALPDDRSSSIVPSVLFFLLLIGLILFIWKRMRKTETDMNKIMIGEYQFDQRNMNLLHGDKRQELTSKESDLLYLLYSSANVTLEREHILNAVWGDEGDYVGRTLDVFISKLRKKLEADSAIKIANVRGVGYKFILNAPTQ